MKNRLFLLVLIFTASLYSCKKDATTSTPPPVIPPVIPPVDQVYRFHDTMTIDGLDRTYTLNLPPNYYEATGFSLVIAMHGGGGSASQFESTSKITDKANAAKFIVVYPEGVQSSGILKARS